MSSKPCLPPALTLQTPLLTDGWTKILGDPGGKSVFVLFRGPFLAAFQLGSSGSLLSLSFDPELLYYQRLRQQDAVVTLGSSAHLSGRAAAVSRFWEGCGNFQSAAQLLKELLWFSSASPPPAWLPVI